MLQYYFRNILQSLSKNKVSWMMNIAGIIIAITVAMMIGLWIHDGLILKK